VALAVIYIFSSYQLPFGAETHPRGRVGAADCPKFLVAALTVPEFGPILRPFGPLHAPVTCDVSPFKQREVATALGAACAGETGRVDGGCVCDRDKTTTWQASLPPPTRSTACDTHAISPSGGRCQELRHER
jgi:hypothetical protein